MGNLEPRIRMFSDHSPEDPPARVYRALSPLESYSREKIAGEESLRSIISSRKISRFFIQKSFESLDYRPLTNEIELEMQKAYTYRTVKMMNVQRILIFLLTGALTGLLGVILELSIEKLGHFKYQEFERCALKMYDGTFQEFLVFVGYRFVGVLVPVMVGTGLVVFIAPYAAGGGVAQCIAYLNGIRVPNVLSIKGMVIKFLSTICTVISGLAGGKEGPMIHIGTTIGGSLPLVLPWKEFTLDNERRDFAAAGFGAGIAAAFGAPLGGLLLALEEGVSFLEYSLMWKIYLCCVAGYALGASIISLIHDGTIDFNNSELKSLGFISSDVTEYEFFELVPFTVMSVIAGLIGAVLIKIHIHVAAFRDRYVRSKMRKMIASFIAACIVGTFQVSAIWLLRSCSSCTGDQKQNSTTTCIHQMYCPEGDRSEMSILFSKTQGDILRLFFGPDILQMSSLGLYAAIYFILMCITMGLSISGGIFIPHIILGAAWGRLFGTFLSKLLNNAYWARPAKYAYIGAAAQLSATVGKTFSILVIFVEASGSIALSFPLMVVVSISRTITTTFVLPIYDTQMHIAGFPFLPQEPPPVECDIPTTKHMSKSPLVTLPQSPTVTVIIDTLRGNGHNGFPVVETKGTDGKPVLVGLILRQQLLILLRYHAYKYPTPTTNSQMCECYETYMRDSRKELDQQKIIDDVEPNFYNTQIDLSPYYNLYPSTTTYDTPMIKTYELFRSLGIRHLVVITKSSQPIGMVTRKDLAKFHTVERCCRVHVKEFLTKD